MSAQWYIRSRGQDRREDDYDWLPVADADPQQLKRIREHRWNGATLRELVDDVQAGLLLAHDPEIGAVVYVTGLTPAEPAVDPVNRPIRAGLIGVARTPTDRADVVAVAVAALNGTLTALPPLSFDVPTAPGFRFDTTIWQRLIDGYRRELDAPDDDPGSEATPTTGTLPPKVGPDTPTWRDHVAADLANLSRRRRMAEMSGRIIVLRRPHIDARQFHAWKPWRTLGDHDNTGAPLPSVSLPGPTDILRRIVSSRRFISFGLAAVAVLAAVAWAATRPDRPAPEAPAITNPPQVSTATRPTPAPTPPTPRPHPHRHSSRAEFVKVGTQTNVESQRSGISAGR